MKNVLYLLLDIWSDVCLCTGLFQEPTCVNTSPERGSVARGEIL